MIDAAELTSRLVHFLNEDIVNGIVSDLDRWNYCTGCDSYTTIPLTDDCDESDHCTKCHEKCCE